MAILAQSRILVADDNDIVLARVVSLLTPHFDVVGTACNGRDLVTEAQRLGPDVVVTDIAMPMLTGLEAVHALRESSSTAKFVFLTVHEQPAFVRACLAEGALGFVTKSQMRMDLIPAINAALSGHCFISRSVPR